jgi:ABC-2 type transport system ATP-binding protein
MGNDVGKSTTIRLFLGLDTPTDGTALVNGRPYRMLRHPLREVGALLDAGRRRAAGVPAIISPGSAG